MRKIIIVLLGSSLLSGCMLGPNFKAPQAPATKHYTPNQIKQTTSAAVHGGEKQVLTYNEDIPASWWRLFHSEALNYLIRQGLSHNPNFSAGKATLRQMQADLSGEIGNTLWPAIDAQFSGQRQRTSLVSEGIVVTPINGIPLPFSVTSIYNLFNASVAVAYNLDIWGASRRHIEALSALVDHYQYEALATFLTLTSNIVTTSIRMASLQQQLDVTRNILATREKQVSLSKYSLRLGHTSKLQVMDYANSLHDSQIELAKLKNDYYRQSHALSVLIGTLPTDNKIPYLNLKQLHLPTDIPISIPSNLIKQRPDIQSAEALLHKASAEVGVATANLFPQLNLTANYGYTGTILSNLFDPVNKIWNYGAQVSMPIFHGGYYFAKRKAAIAAFEYARDNYRTVVLKAFQNVADVLKALEYDAQILKRQVSIEQNAAARLKIISTQYELQKENNFNLLAAQENLKNARLNRIRAEANRYVDTAALFQAMGGGWWNMEVKRGC